MRAKGNGRGANAATATHWYSYGKAATLTGSGPHLERLTALCAGLLVVAQPLANAFTTKGVMARREHGILIQHLHEARGGGAQ
eukprot:scaffold2380_cov102-Isochrysis_galbana.AAC.10